MTSPPGPAASIEALAVAQAMRDIPWLYPTVSTLHILGFVILVGAVVMFDLRVLGLSKQIPVRALARHLLPWSLTAFLVVVPTGLAMFATHATELIASRVFLVKMCLVLAAGMNAAIFHTGPYTTVAAWDVRAKAPLGARACMVVSIAIWIAVIACGRLLPER